MTDTTPHATPEAAQNWRCTSTNPQTGDPCELPTGHHGRDVINNWDLHQDDEGNQW